MCNIKNNVTTAQKTRNINECCYCMPCTYKHKYNKFTLVFKLIKFYVYNLPS